MVGRADGATADFVGSRRRRGPGHAPNGGRRTAGAAPSTHPVDVDDDGAGAGGAGHHARRLARCCVRRAGHGFYKVGRPRKQGGPPLRRRLGRRALLGPGAGRLGRGVGALQVGAGAAIARAGVWRTLRQPFHKVGWAGKQQAQQAAR